MRKLEFSLDPEYIAEIKSDIVPAIFTEKQFNLIIKRFSGKKLSQGERNNFSRYVSKKMKAIYKIAKKDIKKMFVYGNEHILKERKELALKYLKKYSRKFKNKHVLITGSFLYKKEYKDIDIFVIAKYEKDDYKEKKFHINYFDEELYSSLFFRSISKLCISNKKIGEHKLNEEVNINTLISLYQEILNDLKTRRIADKIILRDFIIQSYYLRNSIIIDSYNLNLEVSRILNLKSIKETIKSILIDAIIIGVEKKESIKAMKKTISSYEELMKEYRQHKEYYLDLIEPFKKVIMLES